MRDRAGKRATQTASSATNVLLRLLPRRFCFPSFTYFLAEKYVKEGKQNLRGERNEVRADERQTDSGKF